MNPLQAHLISLLHELAHGPDVGADYGQFSEPGSGLLPALARLDAAQASAPLTPGRSPLAAHVAQLTQLLEFAVGQLNGAVEFPDFGAPWRIGTVDQAAWLTLQRQLAHAFAGLQSALQRRELEPEELNLAQTALTQAATQAGAMIVQVDLLQVRP